MDESMLSSMGGSGMDMDSGGMFKEHNQSLARTYWYLVAACAAVGSSFKILRILDLQLRSVYVLL